MAAAVASYSPDHFQRLPALKDARNDFLNVDGDTLVANVFKDFFVNEGMDRTFGLCMLHRHFDLMPNQKLVEYNGTSTPWTAGSSGMRKPQPSLWAFDDDGLLKPTEFRYAEKQDAPWTEKELAFSVKLKELLSQRGLDKKFGLARYPGDDFSGSCEITLGNANINLKPDDVSDSPFSLHIHHLSSQLKLNNSTRVTWFKSLLSGSSRSLCGREDVVARATPMHRTILTAPIFTPCLVDKPRDGGWLPEAPPTRLRETT
jgi:hypothetical protein